MAGLPTTLPTGPRGRALAAVVTLVGLLLLWLAIVSPLLDWYGANTDALVQRQALAGRMQDLADALPDLRRQVEASQPKDAPTASLLEGASDAVAAATLQGLLETMCRGAGAKITSAEALPAEEVGNYRRIGLKVSLDASWVQLTKLLRAVEKATPRMFVDDLQLHAQPTNDKVRELPLDIALTVLAFRLPGAPPANVANPQATDAPSGDVAAATSDTAAAPTPDAPTPDAPAPEAPAPGAPAPGAPAPDASAPNAVPTAPPNALPAQAPDAPAGSAPATSAPAP